ncbi:hypothetical protein Zm00014a_025835 [Zea mays]|uniref:Uncharacterized protein n=1 Tax=Zea mays TaxID=4577 RepID=A0A3L6DCV2_MAIZE|nr:hypothetical protein Zm00014a_025835 [Zea mays]
MIYTSTSFCQHFHSPRYTYIYLPRPTISRRTRRSCCCNQLASSCR